MQTLLKRIKTYLDPNKIVRIGIVSNSGSFRYVVTARTDNGSSTIVSYGNDITGAFHLPPIAANTTLTDTKVSYLISPLNNEDIDSWLDRNEERIIPPGFTSDQIVNEWDVHDNTVYSATVTKEALQNYLNTFPGNRFLLSSIAVPLWDLGMLYSRYISQKFVIWKITEKGSLLGYVSEGRLQSMCHFWPDYSDIQKDTEKIGNELSPLIRSLTAGEEIAGVIPVCEAENRSLPSDITIPNYTLLNPPVIDSLPVQYHEAYACSLHAETHCDFTVYADTQKSRTLEKKRRYFLFGLRYTFFGVLILTAILVLGALVIAGIQKYTETRIQPLQKYIRQIEESEQRYESLKNEYLQKAGFLGRESIVTYVLNELQVVFPDGTWAQQIEVTEAGEKSWRIDIIALSYSTALVPQIMNNLEKVKGMSNVRMIYSEQTKAGKGQRAVKVKIECVWSVGGG